jgi:mannitol/fructose-specific phosphotransferase system IIA component
MTFILGSEHILLGKDFATKQEVIRAIGEVMLASGDVTTRYVQGMLQKEEQFSTWITEGVAMPHGSNEVKCEVIRNIVVMVQLPKGVDWGGGKTVHLAIGFAGRGDDQHVKVLSQLAAVLQHRERIDRLATTRDKDEAIQIFQTGN